MILGTLTLTLTLALGCNSDDSTGESGPGGSLSADGSGQMPGTNGSGSGGDVTYANLTPQQRAALDACERVTGTRSFDDCPVQTLCSTLDADDVLTIEDIVFEPLTDRCPWGANGNPAYNVREQFDEFQNITTARVEQVRDLRPFLNVPGGQKAVFCSVDISVAPIDSDFEYDDDLLLVFGGSSASSGPDGGALLITRNGRIPDALERPVPGFENVVWPLYTWAADEAGKGLLNLNISNAAGDFDTDLFCLDVGKLQAPTPTCAMPITQESGDFRISLEQETAQALGIRAAITNNYNLTAVTTGDNDPGSDCQHNGFTATVNVSYISLPEAEVGQLAPFGGLI